MQMAVYELYKVLYLWLNLFNQQQIQKLMKTFVQSLIAALLLSTATLAETPATATIASNPVVTTDSYKVAVFPSATPSRLNVYIERNPGQMMSVMLKATDGTLLAKRFVNKKQGNLHFQFDMSELADGTYTVEVISGSNATTYPVTISTKPAQEATRTITLK